jgi:hypothetical protein
MLKECVLQLCVIILYATLSSTVFNQFPVQNVLACGHVVIINSTNMLPEYKLPNYVCEYILHIHARNFRMSVLFTAQNLARHSVDIECSELRNTVWNGFK